MVQLIADLTSPLHAPHNAEEAWRSSNGHYSAAVSSRDELAQHSLEFIQKRGIMTRSKRGWSLSEHQRDAELSNVLQALAEVAVHPPRPISIPEDSPLPSPAVPSPPAPTAALSREAVDRRRPKLPQPRRSYTVMDYEPMLVNQPRPSSKFTLLDLPSEIHYAVLDFLDPIDGVCLGLAHSRLYDIHCRKYGKVPLSSRYSGPNDREWAWRSAGPLVNKGGELERMKLKSQVYCRKCGVSRCELFRHLKDWMGENYEYCEVKQIYGEPAKPQAKSHCFMSSPRDRHRCGRHGAKKRASQAA